ncbi:transient receptor potential cation channel subfamily M member 2-like [Mizuhopecten yessoensis]|uniref:Transient receptor potential cation channel subfamily M member 7 n=1 Tax=Mizuhopecten yessoensis TaxID=6573 RepID=A0A210PTH9_MIZYE|nr:transient receptor potential cation channel subfamily M member 2-like [Mizuhopecten yessoensis]OWF39756.1 Transient receptor potential cation channel subfamily M member 7 [Mizuhopecten yessoensis]
MADKFENEARQSTSRIHECAEDKVRRILTNDRGFIKFEGCDEELGLRRYIRVNDDGKKEGPGPLDDVLKSLMREWELKTPNLLISVTGGAKSFQVKTQQRTAFRRGLIKLARTTDPWIISGGSNTGIMKEVGEAVRDFNLTANCGQSIVAIGIATWGVVQNREHLRNVTKSHTEIEHTIKVPSSVDDLNSSRSYKIERVVNRNETFLNPNHTHFILVDDGSEHQFGKEIAFRAEIENAVANLKTDTGKDAVSVPVVLLVVEGGPNTIETVLNAVCKNTPTVVVKGSGKAADIIAYAYEHAREIIEHGKESGRGRPVSVFDESLKSKIRAMIEEEAWINVVIDDVCKNVEMCVKERNLITVFDITATSEMSQGIDIAILMALMKVKRDNSLSQLKLALCWNRIDIANSEIMRDMSRQSLETALADNDMIMSALGLDRVDFMDLFMDNGVDINTFLTAKRLKQLYHEVSANSILRTVLKKYPKKVDLRSDDCLVQIGILINFLLGDFYEVLAVYKKPDERKSSQSLIEQKNTQFFPRQESSNGLEHKQWGKPQNQILQNDNVVVSKTIVENGVENKVTSTNRFFQNKIEADTRVVSPVKKPPPRLHTMKSAVRNFVSVKGTLEGIHRFENPNLHLFLWCVLTNRQKMAKLFWKYGKDHIAAALVAHGLLKKMSTLVGDKDSEKTLKHNSDEFSRLALEILNECQEKDEKKATDLLTQRIDEWGHSTCEQIAMKTDNKDFVAHATFQSLLSSMWMGELSPLNGLPRILVCIVPLCQPLILWILRFKVDDQREQTEAKQIKSETTALSDNLSIRKQPDDDISEELPRVSGLKKIQFFYQAPVVKFVLNAMSYVAFLTLFSYALLSRFDSSVTGVEVTLFVWVFSLFIEEANQFLSSNNTYFLNKLNILDMLPIVLFLIGVICLLVSGSVPLEVGRIFFSFSFIGFFMRLLGLFSVHQSLGPKLVMITKMFVDLISFLAILMVFVVSYSIAAHAILYPVSRFDGDLLFNLLRIPYWNLYGELILDEMEIKEPECSFDPLLYENDTLPRCPTEIGGYVVPILMGFYMMIANLLLLNLLIAMFSNTFQKVQENSDLYWYFQRFTLIYDYSCRPMLPPPLILVCHVWKLLQWCYWKSRQVCRCARMCCRDCTYKDTSIFGDVCDKEASLTQWEKIVADEYLYRTFHATENTGGDKTKTKTTEDSASSRDALIDLKLDALLAKQEELYANQMRKTGNEEATTEEFITVKKSKLHYLSRACLYPSSSVMRFPVPDSLVSWKSKYKDYDPKLLDKEHKESTEGDGDMPKAEPDRSMLLESKVSLSWNEYDKEYGTDRRSVLGKYKVESGVPRNPVGRTGIIGRGCLGVWGPNHENKLIVTRWATDTTGKKMLRKGKPLFQFLSWKRTSDGDWSIYPEHATEKVDHAVVKELIPNVTGKPTERLESMFQKGQEVYLGYVDSLRNTDNAWIEVTTKSFMDDSQSLQQSTYLNNFIFQEDGLLHLAVWKTASSRDMNSTEQYRCLKSIAKSLRASF